MSQPTTPAPLAAPAPPGPWAPPPVRPARRRRWVLLGLLAVVAVAGPAVLGVRFAVGLRHDVAAAGAATADPLGAGLPPAAATPWAHPSPGLPPSAVPAPSAVLPPATAQPVGLGTDPALDGEARGCFTGEMTACVRLYLESYRDPALARYTAYGDTCAGRQPAGTLRLCTASFPR